MRTGSEVVRSPGKTGSDRRTVRTTRLTHCSHSEAFTGLGCCLGIWPSSEREVDRDLGIEVWDRSVYCTECDLQLGSDRNLHWKMEIHSRSRRRDSRVRPVIGCPHIASPEPYAAMMVALRQG